MMNQWAKFIPPANEADNPFRGALIVIPHGPPSAGSPLVDGLNGTGYFDGLRWPLLFSAHDALEDWRKNTYVPCVPQSCVELLPPHECERLDAEYGLGDLEAR